MILLWLDINSSYAHSSLALPALHAQSVDENWQWNIVSGTMQSPYIHFLKEAMRLKPDVIAATAWLFNHNHLLDVVSRIKAILPHTYIILGGPEFLGDNEHYVRSHPFVDAVFRGEGEEVFHRWLQVWCVPEQRDRLPGICTIDCQGNYLDNGMAKVDCFHKLLPPESSPFFSLSKPFVQIETTRGCFNDCYFCASGGDKPIRSLTMEQIRTRIHELSSLNIQEIRVLDRTFNARPKRTVELLSLFRAFSGKIRFHVEVHPSFLSSEIIDILRDLPCGLLHIEAGIQSLDDRVITLSGRMGNRQKMVQNLSLLKDNKRLEIHGDLIAGLPNYTLARLKEDVKELILLELDEIQLELLKVLPGTRMRKEAASLGIAYAPTPPYEVLATPTMTPEMLHEAQQLSRLLDGWYNGKSDWRKPFVQLTLAYPCFLDSFLHFLMHEQLLEQPLSMERRGLLLYDFCTTHYPIWLPEISAAWITAGYSLKKAPGQHAVPYRYHNQINPDIRYFHLTTPSGDYWFGFDRTQERRGPCVVLRDPPE